MVAFNSNSSSENNFIEHESGFKVDTYTMLAILRRMKETLGLETSLEYMDIYLKTIEKYNPKVQMAVELALKRINVAKIYQEARKWEEKESAP